MNTNHFGIMHPRVLAGRLGRQKRVVNLTFDSELISRLVSIQISKKHSVKNILETMILPHIKILICLTIIT